MKIQEAAENYLEAIYMLKNKLGRVRSIDICKKLNYSKPTVSVMMKQFRENGYIEMDPDGFIVLTDKGVKIAEVMYERHNVIAQLLISIGVDEETAFTDSCKMEHDMSEKSFNCMKQYFLKNNK